MSDQLSFFGEQASPERQDLLRDDLQRLADRIKELSGEINGLEQRLGPFWRDEERLKAAIDRTFTRHNGGIVHSLAKAEERKPLYEGLLQLSLEYGGLKGQRLHAIAMRKGYERDYAKIEKELDMLKRRKDRKHGKT